MPRNRAAVVVMTWGILFAIPSFIWASGGTLGADSTVSPDLVKMARDRVPWFLAVLWLTGFLKLFGSWIGYLLRSQRRTRYGRIAVFCAGGASTLLTGHGLLFVIRGALAETGVAPVKADLAGLIRWYLYLWGPYFVLGGVAFGLAALWYLRQAPDRALILRYAQAGAQGGLLVVAASSASGIG